MSISGSCLPETVKCPGKPLIALQIGIYLSYAYDFTGSTIWADISASNITFKPRSYPTSIDEGTTIAIISGMNFVIVSELSPL